MQAPLIDSHCHLTLIDLNLVEQSMDQLLAEAAACGVQHFLSVCVELQDVPALVNLADKYAQVSFSVGVHPSSVVDNEPDVAALSQLALHPACIAIGETGLDYARLTTEDEKNQQQQRFRAHIRAARQVKKPLIIHTRAAAEDTLRLLREENAIDVGGVMHCFTETWEMAKAALDLHFYISYSGIISFKNADAVRAVALRIPSDRLLVETDAPYLAPVPFRGKVNRPAWVKYTAEYLAALRSVPFETLALETTQNFKRCFGILSQN